MTDQTARQLSDDGVMMILGTSLVDAIPAPSMGEGYYTVKTDSGLRFLHSTDGREAEDVTAHIAQVLAGRIKAANDKSSKGQAAQRAHLKRVEAMEPIDWQNRHDPSEKVMVAHSIGTKILIDERGEHAVVEVRRTEQGRRRIADARLMDALGGNRQDAMAEIENGYRALVSGLGMKPASVERASKSHGGISESQAIAATDYNHWIEAVDTTLLLNYEGDMERCGKPMTFGVGRGKHRWTMERLCAESATAIICHGKAIATVASERQKRKEWVRDNLKQAIDVWLRMKNRLPWPNFEEEDKTAPLTIRQVRIRQANRRVIRVKHDDPSEKERVIRKS